jgi:hypothetical protein
MDTRRVAAAVALGLLVASGCVDATRAPSTDRSAAVSPDGSPSPSPSSAGIPQSTRRGDASGSPSPSGGSTETPRPASALELIVDASLEATLPEQMGAIRFVRHSLRPGEVPPPGFSDGLGLALLRAAGSAGTSLSVAWIEPAPEDADLVEGLTVVAIRIPGAVARNLREVVAADHLMTPGVSGTVRLGQVGPRSMLIVGDAAVASFRDTLYVLSFPGHDARSTPPPGPAPTAPFTEAELFAALPETDPESEPPAMTPRPLPSIAPDASPPPDPAAEALLPDHIRGIAVTKLSGRGPALFSGEWTYLGLPAYALYQQLGLNIQELSAAGGHPDGLSTFWIVATPVPGLEARTILAAWFHPLLGNGWNIETVEADGRVAVVYGDQAVHAADGVLYWMTYLDLGDFPPASPPPRPAFRDLVVEVLRALP